jgi:protein tyrosine/serine phosphatase
MTRYSYPNRSSIYYFLLLLALIATALPVGQSSAQSVRQSSPIAIEIFVMYNHNFSRGSQPAAEHLKDLKRLGVKTIIDLRKDQKDEAPGWASAAELQYVNIPLTTKRPATEEQTAQFLKLINDPANWPVYVHCKGGRHRTGEMTAIYRITHDGWTGDQAYEEMKKYDFKDSIFYPRALKKYVFSYYERFESQKKSSVEAVVSP